MVALKQQPKTAYVLGVEVFLFGGGGGLLQMLLYIEHVIFFSPLIHSGNQLLPYFRKTTLFFCVMGDVNNKLYACRVHYE